MKTIFYTFFISIIFLKASLTWGFSDLRTYAYLKQAQKEKLWTDPQWIKLGHYEKGLFSYSSPFKIGFFLSEDGAESPEKELLKSIETLFSLDAASEKDLNKHPQCRYLARTKWLTKVLRIDPEDLLPCTEIQQWKKDLNVTSVAVIFAAADLGNASSSYGHTFLKIINPENAKNKDLIDYGVNYAANADDSNGFFYAIKGLFGMYPGQFTMLPYHQKISEYINLEGRDIWEYHLNFTAEEVSFLVDHLIEIENGRAPYYFFTDNCSYQILRSIEVVRPQLNMADEFKYFVIPIDTIKKISKLSSDFELNLVDHVKYKKSLKVDYLQNYAQLGSLQKKALNVAVEKFVIPSDYELNNSEKAAVYETAMKYYALKAFKSKSDFEEEKYKLYLERVKLGQQNTVAENNILEPPEKSHDSSALYLGFGSRDQRSFSSFKFRNAFHDLEQPDFGTVPFSQNEMASVELRYTEPSVVDKNSENSFQGSIKNLQLYKFTLLNLINLNPVTQLDANYSWKIQASVMNEWKPFTQFGAGYGFDLNLFQRSRLTYFITAQSNSEFNSEGDYTYLTGLGPNMLLVTRFSNYLGLSIDLNYFIIDRHPAYFKYRTKLNYNLKQNFDIQLQAENFYDKTAEYQTQLVWNFIF